MRITLAALTACSTLQQSMADIPEKGRVVKQTYFFEEASKDMEYALYLPTAYDPTERHPLLVLLHGYRSDPHSVMKYAGITEEAEARGYVVVAPDGYNGRGWYGSPRQGEEGQVIRLES